MQNISGSIIINIINLDAVGCPKQIVMQVL